MVLRTKGGNFVVPCLYTAVIFQKRDLSIHSLRWCMALPVLSAITCNMLSVFFNP